MLVQKGDPLEQAVLRKKRLSEIRVGALGRDPAMMGIQCAKGQRAKVNQPVPVTSQYQNSTIAVYLTLIICAWMVQSLNFDIYKYMLSRFMYGESMANIMLYRWRK